MKNLKSYIIETLIRKPEIDPGNDELYGYDSEGEAWEVMCISRADDTHAEKIDSLAALLRDFDAEGEVQSQLDTMPNNVKATTWVVGAHLVDDERDMRAWIWGPTGICIENK